MKDNKEKRDRTIFDLWLACATQDEIAEKIGVPRKTIDDWIGSFGETTATGDSPNFTDFTPPLYNIWKQQTKTEGSISAMYRSRSLAGMLATCWARCDNECQQLLTGPEWKRNNGSGFHCLTIAAYRVAFLGDQSIVHIARNAADVIEANHFEAQTTQTVGQVRMLARC